MFKLNYDIIYHEFSLKFYLIIKIPFIQGVYRMDYTQIIKELKNHEKIRKGYNATTRRAVKNRELQRSHARVHPRTSYRGGIKMPRMQEATMYQRMPCRGSNS